MQMWRSGALRICLTFLLAQGAAAAETSKSLPSATNDGRFGTRCYWTFKSPGDLCETSFYAILASPEKFDERPILLVGYLALVDGQPVLFANKLSYESGSEGEGIALLDAKLTPNLQKRASHGAWPVTVVGVFDAKFPGYVRPRLGAMREIRTVDISGRVDRVIYVPQGK